jgi:hypothetical protein
MRHKTEKKNEGREKRQLTRKWRRRIWRRKERTRKQKGWRKRIRQKEERDEDEKTSEVVLMSLPYL